MKKSHSGAPETLDKHQVLVFGKGKVANIWASIPEQTIASFKPERTPNVEPEGRARSVVTLASQAQPIGDGHGLQPKDADGSFLVFGEIYSVQGEFS